jgi:hypothetical protein
MIKWVILPINGLAGLRVFNWLAASVAAALLMKAGQRTAGWVGGCCALFVALEPHWLHQIWEARAYAFFLAVNIWALWQTVRLADDEDSAGLGGVVAAVAVASIENPLSVLILAGLLPATLRRRGWAAVTRSTWAAVALVGLMVGPLAYKAVTAHQNLSHFRNENILEITAIIAVLMLPGFFRRTSRGLVAETTFLLCLGLLGALVTEVIPVANRTLLFLYPWALIGLLTQIPSGHWAIRWGLLAGLVLNLNFQYRDWHRMFQSPRMTAENGRVMHEEIEKLRPEEVRFRPRWTRPTFVSSFFDLRAIKQQPLEAFPDFPQRYSNPEEAECAPGEVGVRWNQRGEDCDCPIILSASPWDLYRCPPAAGDRPSGER